MKAYRCSKQLRRRRPNRTGARAPSPEYRIGDRHKRSHRAKQEIGLDYFLDMPTRLLYDYDSPIVSYHKRGARVSMYQHPLKVPIYWIEDFNNDTSFNLPPWMASYMDDSLF